MEITFYFLVAASLSMDISHISISWSIHLWIQLSLHVIIKVEVGAQKMADHSTHVNNAN